jgi:hypothetical protein
MRYRNFLYTTKFIILINTDDSLSVNLDNLLIQLKPQVGPKWYKFGVAAGIEKDVLDKFAEQCSPDDCIVEVLDYWLRKSNKLHTWSDVAKILKDIDLSGLAHDIEGIYTTGNNIIIIFYCIHLKQLI